MRKQQYVVSLKTALLLLVDSELWFVRVISLIREVALQR